MTARTAVTLVQAASFVLLGYILAREGEGRLAFAQFALAAITVAVYL